MRLTLNGLIKLNPLTANVLIIQKPVNWFTVEITGFHAMGTLIVYGVTQLTFTCSKSTTEILEKGLKYVESEL